MTQADFVAIYARFKSPIAALNCGHKCAPYNERGVPFCCDTLHAVPAAYEAEWVYLKANSDLWRPWVGKNSAETEDLRAQTPSGQVLIACLGYSQCQRGYRSITCRSFPFFPYINSKGDFLGLSYYWEYEDRCWVISNLDTVTAEYRDEFIDAYETIFEHMPDEHEVYAKHSKLMRNAFQKGRRAVPLLHSNGFAYKISPTNERMRRVPVAALPSFGPYQIAKRLPFPAEVGG
ncbi:MAG: hypothetical protein P8X95_02950 [Anaerolineales bacterium]|jgi:hypothetical protein